MAESRAMQESIFVSYRRQTDSGIAGRIYDSLSRALPNVAIFIDVDKLTPGEDFEVSLQKNLESCKVLLAIIGPQWAMILDHGNRRRLDNADDYVRKELATALAKNVRVIPVLIGGAQMPDAGTLPPDLQALARRQAMEIRHERFNDDVNALAHAIAAITSGAGRSRWPTKTLAAAAALTLALVATGGVLWLSLPPGNGQHSGSQPATRSDGHNWTTWMDRQAYQNEFDRQLKNEWYPNMVEAQLQDGTVKYRAVFLPRPSTTFQFSSRHSINDEEFAQFDAEMTKQGFKRIFQQRITVEGRPFNQATWIKP